VIRDDAGAPTYAVLPFAEYTALREELAELHDARAYDAGAAGPFVSGEVVARIVAGENPVRVWREQRALKLTQLAERAGMSHSYLSQIENGHREGSVRALAAIARALDVDLDNLVAALTMEP
jgi:DNA-binding Xre family transcriptional regulator